MLILEPGKSAEAKVSRKGKDLEDADVTVTSPDKDVTVEGGKFKGEAKEATVTIKASPEAADKEHNITVKAGDVTKTIKVRVQKAGSGAAGKDKGSGSKADKDEK